MAFLAVSVADSALLDPPFLTTSTADKPQPSHNHYTTSRAAPATRAFPHNPLRPQPTRAHPPISSSCRLGLRSSGSFPRQPEHRHWHTFKFLTKTHRDELTFAYTYENAGSTGSSHQLRLAH